MKSLLLDAHDLAIGYTQHGKNRILAQALNLQIRSGELIGLLGYNGAGKSTLLRTLAGLQNSLAGYINVTGDLLVQYSASERAKILAVLLTDRIAWGEIKVYELVALGRHPHTDYWGNLSEADETIISNSLQALDVTNLSARLFSELSDGEKQRVLLARCLAQQTPVLILDEPLAFLDWPHKVEVLQLLRKLTRETSQGILFSAHDPELVLKAVDQIWLLHPGGLLQKGSAKEFREDAEFRKLFSLDALIGGEGK